ncbi:GntR family transcriptional regulator [Amorphus orientalis]|uniref:GntR family transcriptional regulator n=1 Tax=Amorphus orientalis TaxID=649198 RepID=A0AAE3VMW1_9HYPH|nr:GntR family transcriptional regulator [Amorphus orientalis]MDQ0314972.1 GntR family transcriptional regulator [Amorphus orientalis]
MSEADGQSRTARARGGQKSKHRLIAEQLLNAIEAGRWRPGEQLPSEEQLATETGSSLGTVQRALRNLVEMGVVERHHGRGTFVTGARAQERQLRHFRFTAEGGTQLLPVYFNMLGIEITRDTGPWKDFLQDPTDTFVRIHRLVSVNKEFEVFSEVYLPEHRFRDLATMKTTTLDGVSIRDMLAERFNAPTLNIRQTIVCQTLPPRVTRLIDQPAGQSGIVWTICGMSYRDTPITWQRVFVPPSDRVLEMGAAPLGEGAAKR